MIRWVRFKTTLFGPEPEEETEVNPGKCGKQLAHWLAERLPAAGLHPKAIYPEDWGYEISIAADRHVKYIGCQNVDGTSDEWGCFVEVKQGLLNRLRSPLDVSAEISRLEKELTRILSAEPRISVVEWDDG